MRSDELLEGAWATVIVFAGKAVAGSCLFSRLLVGPVRGDAPHYDDHAGNAGGVLANAGQQTSEIYGWEAWVFNGPGILAVCSVFGGWPCKFWFEGFVRVLSLDFQEYDLMDHCKIASAHCLG